LIIDTVKFGSPKNRVHPPADHMHGNAVCNNS